MAMTCRCSASARHDGREHVGGPQAAVQQQQGLALAADLVVIVEAVGLDVAGLVGRLCGQRRVRQCDERGEAQGLRCL